MTVIEQWFISRIEAGLVEPWPGHTGHGGGGVRAR
jgi:hypothetical protein